ncbi:proline-rich protein 2-like [Suncus etruscus]|uniref:proline-rich protein 2-like n=1 Tax=Suncus etruscus TaxID=109475 RepID=UPI0021108D20|nr:proline-rich protein 2-like [Suncus etruscus]
MNNNVQRRAEGTSLRDAAHCARATDRPTGSSPFRLSPGKSQSASPGATSPGALGLRRRLHRGPQTRAPRSMQDAWVAVRALRGLLAGSGTRDRRTDGRTNWGDAPREAQSPALQSGGPAIRLRGWESRGCPPRQVGREARGLCGARAGPAAGLGLPGRAHPAALRCHRGDAARCRPAASSSARQIPAALPRAAPARGEGGRVPGPQGPPPPLRPYSRRLGRPPRTQPRPHPGSSPGCGGARPAPTRGPPLAPRHAERPDTRRRGRRGWHRAPRPRRPPPRRLFCRTKGCRRSPAAPATYPRKEGGRPAAPPPPRRAPAARGRGLRRRDAGTGRQPSPAQLSPAQPCPAAGH